MGNCGEDRGEARGRSVKRRNLRKLGEETLFDFSTYSGSLDTQLACSTDRLRRKSNDPTMYRVQRLDTEHESQALRQGSTIVSLLLACRSCCCCCCC